MCCISLVWHIFYLISLAMTICGDARRNVSLPSRGRDSRVLHSGFSRVRIYHNFCRDAELIHYPFQAQISFISRLKIHEWLIDLTKFRCCTCSRINDLQRHTFIIRCFSPILVYLDTHVIFNCYLTLKCLCEHR